MPPTLVLTSTPTRSTYQTIPSPLQPKKAHATCFSVDYLLFGTTCSCTRPLLEEINNIIDTCRAFIPSLSIQLLLKCTTVDTFIQSDFPAVGPFSSGHFFSDSLFQINQLREASQALSAAAALRPKIIFQLKHHRSLPSDHIALVVLGNLETLHDTTVKKMVGMEGFLWQEFDGHPEQAAGKLTVLVNQSTISSSEFNGHLAFVKYQDFSTLGTGRWVNDEVVNYFVDKWCTKSGTTLGLNSFFARRYLFDEATGCPKTGVLTVEDRVSVLRWCHKTAVKQSLQDWDSVFIPINEMGTHWYSARIDFLQKRIDIYDSLRERFISNHKKPPLLRKNANLMLVLLWLTEVLSQLRGKAVDLKNNGDGRWIFDPHFKVHFQPNSYDCGVHLLWHLRHILEFRQVKPGNCQPSHLRFTNDMVGKRLRLAQEILVDAGLV